MKKILIRAGMSPVIETPPQEIITYNRIGDNVGNLVYAYSLFRALTTDEDVEIIPTNYIISRLDVDEINETYDSFVIPLADAIRNSFVPEMKRLTTLVNKLKIPCYAIGMGIRAPYDYETEGIEFEHDDSLYKFVEAVLNKSGMIGIRGEITADYLKKLGFVPEVDFTVTGCPSLYTYGEDLDIKPLDLKNISKLAINNTVMGGENTQDFLNRAMKEFPNHTYYPQRVNELATLYLGQEYHYERETEGYPADIFHRLYQEDRVRFHTNIYSWIRDLSEKDLSIGPRLHGNVAAILAGIPAVCFVHDARMKELAKYHNLPSIIERELNPNQDIMEVLAKIDYKSFLKGHRERFRHYVDFLDKIGIEHIFKDYKNPKEAPFDIKAKKLGFKDKDYSVKSFLKCDMTEIIERINIYKDYSQEKAEELKEERQDLINNHKIKVSNLKDKMNKVQTEFKEVKAELKEVKTKFKETKAELKKVKTDLEKTNANLKEVKAELREAKRSIWYRIRRKIRNLINRIRGKNRK